MNKNVERLYNGIVKENPTFILMLGMCPTLAVTTSATNAIGMGLSTMVVLIISNFVISLFRKLIPDEVRLPAYIVIVASFVTVVQLVMQAYFVEINKSLGVYIPLIVVNCIILGRAEAYASKNDPIPSIFDGLGMGLGFTLGLFLLGAFRELRRYRIRHPDRSFLLRAYRSPGKGTRCLPGPRLHHHGHECMGHLHQSQQDGGRRLRYLRRLRHTWYGKL